MGTNKKVESTSKFLSLILRHEPQLVGLTLGDGGWVRVDELLTRCAQANKPISYELLKEVVETSDKKRFALSEDGALIRANQGHSVAVDLGLSPTTPPDKLYHGTASRFLDAIWVEGLTRRERHHVHLTAKLDVAMSVGQRHGQPVILEVDSLQMHLDGHKFFQSDNGVWLVGAVAVHYMRLLPQE
ncbi:RNA 2'-phosphotransferase [Aquabacterium sp. NJ1]|uniref:RNA 2'-phosphotransferase n=1 Tax=Aquabacterium sp. NJ1 TaxID=1538295 RepID=UPI00052D705A|nr:RNA 2'-phosphotransferase [Aquabacterium sp. NJ1]KGM40424.1 RNA 2'-phosphotransferase [Aquabacterium sp. NJ1]